jgi:hypothetical protein
MIAAEYLSSYLIESAAAAARFQCEYFTEADGVGA